jgi:hypothetical protein
MVKRGLFKKGEFKARARKKAECIGHTRVFFFEATREIAFLQQPRTRTARLAQNPNERRRRRFQFRRDLQCPGRYCRGG